MRTVRTMLAAAVAIALLGAATTPVAWAKKLDDTFIRIEVNATDGDAGIHVFLDGEGWDSMQMTGPNGVEFSVLAENSVGFQGITEFFFESAEPSFDVQTLEELLAIFPQGLYRFKGTTTEGKKLRGKARLKHAIPDAPVQVAPLEGDEIDPANAVFSWQAVADPPGDEIVAYEVVIECEEPEERVQTFQVGANVTSITAPPEVFGGVDECKWEVLSIADNGNQTISEVEFDVP